MKTKATGILILLVCLASVLAGCTGSSGSGTAAPAGGSAGSGSSPQDNLKTSPTDVIPENNLVSVTVKEKVYDGTIPVSFDGGKGQSLVSSVEVTLYTSDGQTATTSLGKNKGDEVILKGTKNPDKPDRVVVYVSEMNGQRYKVADVLSIYRQH